MGGGSATWYEWKGRNEGRAVQANCNLNHRALAAPGIAADGNAGG